MLFENDSAMEFLKSIIRIGEVSSVDAAKGTARVVFDDFDAVVSYDLQVVCRNTFSNRDYVMPDIGEDVLCVFLPTGTEAGFVLGSVYAGEVTPPENTIDKRTTEFADGARFSYDRAAHEFTGAIGEDTAIVSNTETTTIQAQTVHLGDDVGATEKASRDDHVQNELNGIKSALDKLAQDFNTFVSTFNSHTHLSAAPASPTGTPTASTPPSTALPTSNTYSVQATESDSVYIK